MFQFLLVRLRVDEIIDSAPGVPMFQFLLVRLRVTMNIKDYYRE